jgi:hypothetical protein
VYDAYRPHAGYQRVEIYEAAKRRTDWMDKLSFVLFLLVWGWAMAAAYNWAPSPSVDGSGILFLASAALFLLARVLRWGALRTCPSCRAPLSHWDHPTELLVVHFCDTCRIYTEEPIRERRDN